LRRHFGFSGLLILIAVTIACGGGGGSSAGGNSDGGTPTPQVTITSVSNSSPMALTPLYVKTSGLNTSATFSVSLANNSGFSVNLIPLRSQADGTVVLAMPLYISPSTGQTSTVSAALTIAQGGTTSAPVNVTIQDIPQNSDYGTNLGDISRAFFNFHEMALGRMLNGLQSLQAMPSNTVNTTTVQSHVNGQFINVIKARNDLDRIVTNNQLEINPGTLNDGTSVNFDSNSVSTLDRILGMYLTVLQPNLPTPNIKKEKLRHSDTAQNGKSRKKQIAKPDGVSMPALLNSIGTVTAGETVYGSVRTNLQSDSTYADRLLAVGNGAAATVGIVATIAGAPEIAAAAVLTGVVYGVCSVANDIYHIGTDVVNIMTLSNSGSDQAALTAAQNDMLSSAVNLPFDVVSTALGALSVPANGVASLGEEVVAFYEGVPQLQVQGSALVVSTLQLFAQNLVNDANSAQSAAAQLQTTFSSPDQGFAEVMGPAFIANAEGPILSGLTGVAIDDQSGAYFYSLADELGNYDVLIPIGDTALNYNDMTINAFDPVTSNAEGSFFDLASMPLDLSGVTSTQPFLGPILSGTCDDTDAGAPDADDPDCD
jgi:hypothetical protein